MSKTYKNLGSFSDLRAVANQLNKLFPLAKPGAKTRKVVHDALAFWPRSEKPQAVRLERRWERDGVAGEEISWSVGYGPRTKAWVLRPAGVKGKLPGALALHCHGAYKFYGKEKVAEGPTPVPKEIRQMWEKYYGNRAFANALAREGFTVLAHDTFSWGSRKFALASMPDFERNAGGILRNFIWSNRSTREIGHYNSSALLHEATLAKYCLLLGTTLGGVVNYEDRVALNYLGRRTDVGRGPIGCLGQSGGGLRSALLQATSDRIGASVTSGSMTTYEGMLDRHVGPHNWMFYLPGWSHHGEWPDLAACRAPSPLMVQYALDDELFSVDGMKTAHRRIQKHYCSVGKPSNYAGKFYPGRHQFNLKMQVDAFEWLAKHLD